MTSGTVRTARRARRARRRRIAAARRVAAGAVVVAVVVGSADGAGVSDRGVGSFVASLQVTADRRAAPGPSGSMTAVVTPLTTAGVGAASGRDADDAAVPRARAATPLRVVVGAVGIDVPLVELGLGPDGAVEAPQDFDVAGWYVGSSRPGEAGPAVLAGHVDSSTGPAAFFRLAELAVGDDVVVHRADATVARFRVTRVERHPKDGFPTAAVYGAVPGPALRLITCGGDFDRAAGSYRDNVVVYAVAV
ncbi:MAG: class F sortase [Actinomycetota bacterium]|nr:class F sortase [Actinomycetota bacterium]